MRRGSLALVALVAVLLVAACGSSSRPAGAHHERRLPFDLSLRHGHDILEGFGGGFQLRWVVIGADYGAIPAIRHPRFDSATVADRNLHPDDLVLGVDIAGDARAYPTKVLALHEVVNDTVGGRPVAITWCPLCSSGLVFDRRVAGRILTFGISGLLYGANQILVDDQTRSLWSQLGEGGLTGVMRGRRLTLVPAREQSWSAWRSAHAHTRVLSIRKDLFATRFLHPRTYVDHFGEESSDDPYLAYEQKIGDFYWRPVDGIPKGEQVAGVEVGRSSKAYPQHLIEQRHVVDDTLAGVPLVVFWSDQAYRPAVFSRRLGGSVLRFRWNGRSIRDTATGSRWSASSGAALTGRLAGSALQPLPYSFPYWFAWRKFHPRTAIARP
jgi:hypothetical protein